MLSFSCVTIVLDLLQTFHKLILLLLHRGEVASQPTLLCLEHLFPPLAVKVNVRVGLADQSQLILVPREDGPQLHLFLVIFHEPVLRNCNFLPDPHFTVQKTLTHKSLMFSDCLGQVRVLQQLAVRSAEKLVQLLRLGHELRWSRRRSPPLQQSHHQLIRLLLGHMRVWGLLGHSQSPVSTNLSVAGQVCAFSREASTERRVQQSHLQLIRVQLCHL
mmetsp:Transcript_55697/g.148528  ORF Transcript_55697/g.148528 Transcript_55697/m.148528 type:complete len:217 (-) Transcript_55697:269-919(-)